MIGIRSFKPDSIPNWNDGSETIQSVTLIRAATRLSEVESRQAFAVHQEGWRPSLELNQDVRQFPVPASPFRHRAATEVYHKLHAISATERKFG
jgi:hypothetical protein